MKLFDVDWEAVLQDLPRWLGLPRPARRVLLDQLKPHGYVAPQALGDALPAIVASGIAAYDATRGRVWAEPDRRELLKVLRAMDRHRVFDAPDTQTLIEYLEDHFTNYDIQTLAAAAHRSYGVVTRYTLAARLAFSGWVADLLNARGDAALSSWAADRGWGPQAGRPLASIHTLEHLRQLARRLAAHAGGVPLAELIARDRPSDLSAFAKTLHVGLATGVLFAGLRGADLEPLVGLWPPVAQELTRPTPHKPTPVAPVERFVFAIGMEDMTTALTSIAAAPLRVRANDGAVFARARVAIEERLVPVPPWAAHLFTNDRWTRVDEAVRELELYRFAHLGEHDGNPHVMATANGKRWLALGAHDRLARLIDPLRNAKDENPGAAYDVNPAEGFFPFVLPFYRVPKSLRLRHALTAAFLTAGHDEWIPIEDFLDYASREANPFLELEDSPAPHEHMMYYDGSQDPRESARNLWRNMLAQFLVVRLLRTGGASVGRTEAGTLCFSLTGVGRYLFGAADRFDYGSNDSGEIVVQPNFDIVFLGAAPSVEATLARFAERVGSAPGLAFKITRHSVLAAAEAGASADDVLGALRSASSKPLPKNVEKEIAGWVGSVRRARVRSIEVIECGDDETARRVADVLGAKARRLTPTVFELVAPTAAARASTLKRLRAGGVFLEEDESRLSRRPNGRGRRTAGLWADDEGEDES